MANLMTILVKYVLKWPQHSARVNCLLVYSIIIVPKTIFYHNKKINNKSYE